MKWRFLDTGFQSGLVNMKYDEALAQELAQGGETATLRVYGWNPHAISIGKNQSLQEIDLEKAKCDGINVVRRPTGGRAILHSDEITYSVVLPSKSRSVLHEYDLISQALVLSLRKLGADVTLETTQAHFPSVYAGKESVLCYASAAQYEIRLDGKKLVGSAQRRYSREDGSEIVLQHGSILLGPDHKRITEYISVDNENSLTNLRSILDNESIDLSTVLDRKVRYDEVADCLFEGFGETFGIEFERTEQLIVSTP